MTVYRLPVHILLYKAIPMPLPHPLPVPPALFIHACDEVDRRVGHLPFHRNGIEVGRSLVGTALEELNAEPTRALALREYTADGGRVRVDGLDVHLALRGIEGEGAAAVIAEVLIQAGIAQKVSIPDRRSRRVVQGVRLLLSWTWHIESDPKHPIPKTENTVHVPEDLRSWKNLCPVCRAGTLNAVTGQRLFGIMPTDFIACTYCGAKFVPDNNDYRLVSIAKKSDPIWGRHLNKTMSPDAWEAIAHQSGFLAKGHQFRTRGDQRQKATTRANEKIIPNPQERLAVPVGSRTYYFTALTLHYQRRGIHDLYSRNTISLQEIIRLPAYRSLAPAIHDQYSNYLGTPVGFFLLELKKRKDMFYREFLHEYGDQIFCSFRTDDDGIAKQNGVFVVAVNGEVMATGASLNTFCRTVNDELGWLLPETCYCAGDPFRCHINALLCRYKNDGGIFVHPVKDEDEVHRIAHELHVRYTTKNDGAGGWCQDSE
jgi:hypothetical protein